MEGNGTDESITQTKPTSSSVAETSSFNASLPVVYKIGKGPSYMQTEVIVLADLDVNKVYYSLLLYSDNDKRFSFRIKLIHQGDWCLYIAYWEQNILDDKFVRFKSPFKYRVTICDVNAQATLVDNYQINQLFHNTWMHTYFFRNNSTEAFTIKVREVIMKTLPVIQLPRPFMLELTYGDHRSVTLTGRDSSKIVVLQSVLEAHSEIFSRMFVGDWIEKKERCVEIDLDKEGLQEFRSYMYCYIAPKDCAAQLFPVAHMYDMKHLMFVCAGKLRDEVMSGKASAMDVMALALQYKYKPLVAAVWSYWEEHHNEIAI